MESLATDGNTWIISLCQNEEGLMNRLRNRAGWVATGCVAACVLAVLSPATYGGEGEEREFAVTVDGKRAGSYRLAVHVRDDGTETVSAAAEVKIRTLLGSYTYTLRSLEVWKNGRLVSVTATSDDDGKKHTVKASAGDDALTIVVDGRSRTCRGDFLTSTGWRVPRTPDKSDAPLLLDTEDGTTTPVRVE